MRRPCEFTHSRVGAPDHRPNLHARGVSSSSTTKDPHCPPPAYSRGSPLCWAQHEHPEQIINIHNQWNCYKAPEEGEAKRARSQHLFSVRKCSVLQNNREAEVNYVLVCGVLLVVSLFEHFWRLLKWFAVAHHGRQHTHAHRRYSICAPPEIYFALPSAQFVPKELHVEED
ncbi:hypothetical protein TRIUR3_31793 [Triticum urartu]|uniref:Uncharacterized protein n=2 Tax=Triticum urartu TaxID=4572 RepID=M7YWM9_TRIUA|nr:hypothetical protein TRIUR3_31793 [Triticum urartu]